MWLFGKMCLKIIYHIDNKYKDVKVCVKGKVCDRTLKHEDETWSDRREDVAYDYNSSKII